MAWRHPGEVKALAPPVTPTGKPGADFAAQVAAELKMRGEPAVSITAYSDPSFIDTWIVTIDNPGLHNVPIGAPSPVGIWAGSASFLISPESGGGGYTPADWAQNQLDEARTAAATAKATIPGFGVRSPATEPVPAPVPVNVPTTLQPGQVSVGGMGVAQGPASPGGAGASAADIEAAVLAALKRVTLLGNPFVEK